MPVIAAFSRPGDLVAVPGPGCAALAAAAARTGRRVLGIAASPGGQPGGASCRVGQAVLAVTVVSGGLPAGGTPGETVLYAACQRVLRPGGVLAVIAARPAPGQIPDLSHAVAGGPPLPWTVTTLGSLGTGGTPMVTKYQKFADGYKAEAVKLYRESNQTIAETARNLGLKESTLANWVKKDKDNEAVAVGEAPLTPAERTRIRELEADVRRLNIENAFLKKGVPRAREVA